MDGYNHLFHVNNQKFIKKKHKSKWKKIILSKLIKDHIKNSIFQKYK
jgi:hypothetical protein